MDLAIDLFVDVQGTVDGLFVSRVQTERPAIFNQVTNDGLELGLHRRRHVGSRLEKILEISRRVDEHLAGAVHSIKVVTVAGLCDLRPLFEVR